MEKVKDIEINGKHIRVIPCLALNNQSRIEMVVLIPATFTNLNTAKIISNTFFSAMYGAVSSRLDLIYRDRNRIQKAKALPWGTFT